MGQPAVPRPAATVVLLRPATGGGFEVLLTQRPATMAFAPDMHVFPGGALDAGDADPRAIGRSRLVGEPADELKARIAALRELFEEAGVLLADRRQGATDPVAVERAREALLANRASMADVAEVLDLELRTDRLLPLSRWVTPPFVERRFDVRFFVAELPPQAAPTFRASEVVAHRWLTPRAALDAMAGGEIGLWVPTSTTLQQLEHVRSFEQIAGHLAPARPEPIRVIRESPAIARVVLPGAGAVPGQTVNGYVVGERELVVIDPGDPSDEAADALLAVARDAGGTIRAIALTSSAPDHHAGAEALAGRIDVPVFGGPGVGRDLAFDVRELADGERLPAGDTELRVVATPGPRPDHIAIAATDEAAMFTGDLTGGAGHAVLPPPDADALRASSQAVAALGFNDRFPGHGH
jgi:glyoxylase-like metal-dependent hydrolase (beta-lactamase superfamily II)/8-oxo-dGTP pyrophosphatase MutT (NUDIX family)